MKKIVVVEDNQIVAGVYRAKLQVEGFRVEVAADGKAGLEMIERIRPDLVLLDLILPEMGGVEILQKLRAQAEFKALPVIVFSSSYVSDEAWQAGATQVLNKASHSPKQVVEEVKNVLAAYGAPPSTAGQSLPSNIAAAAPQAASVEAPRASSLDADAEFQAGLRKTLLETAPETLSTLDVSLQAFIKNGSDATNVFDLYRRIHAITGNAGLAGLRRVYRMTTALEALLKEISEKPKLLTPSVQRTIALAVNFLPALFSHTSQHVEENTSAATALVVDDEEIARRAVSYGIEKAGFRALRIGEAATALKVLVENHFDLILLDIEMPEMNGFELCTKLRALPLHGKTPVIFITTLGEFQRHAQTSMTTGNDLIAKPFPYSELAVKASMLILKGQLEK